MDYYLSDEVRGYQQAREVWEGQVEEWRQGEPPPPPGPRPHQIEEITEEVEVETQYGLARLIPPGFLVTAPDGSKYGVSPDEFERRFVPADGAAG